MPSAILTRSHQENRRLAPVFRRRGFRVFGAPMIELLPIPPDGSITQQWLAAGGSRVILTSAAAAQQWLAALPNLSISPDSVRYWIVGQRSRDLVQTRFPNSPIEVLANSGAELLRQIPPGLAGPAILYPCSSQRRDELVEGLRNRGARVMEFPLYRPQLPANAARRLRTAIRGAGFPLCFVFFSPSAVANFISLQPELPHGAIFAAVGSTTAQALRGNGVADVITPPKPNGALLADAILEAIEQP